MEREKRGWDSGAPPKWTSSASVVWRSASMTASWTRDQSMRVAQPAPALLAHRQSSVDARCRNGLADAVVAVVAGDLLDDIDLFRAVGPPARQGDRAHVTGAGDRVADWVEQRRQVVRCEIGAEDPVDLGDADLG